MNTIVPGSNIQNAYSPIAVGGKIGGNIGKGVADANGSVFGDLFSQALQNVEETDAIKNADSYNLAGGDIDDLAAMMVNSERAQVAFQLLVELRNKVLDGYSELMRMNV